MKFEGKHKKNNQEEDLASYYLPCMDKKKKLVTAIVIFILLATQLDYIDQNITFYRIVLFWIRTITVLSAN
jgi:hypothetical protein